MRLPAHFVACLGLACAATAADAQQLRTTHVAGNVFMISGAGGNVTVSTGDNGVLLVDAGSAEMSESLLRAVREISDGPIRYVINTSILPEHIGGNAVLRAAGETFTGGNATVVGGVGEGAAVVGYESLLLRLAGMPQYPTETAPTETFFVPKLDLYFNDEPVEIIHQPQAVDDTNTIVHFRRSDVISAGDVFRIDSYPYFDIENGGSINGIIAALNALVDLAIADTLQEGGTLIIPGHGRICDEGDLVRYRDMITIIRDRIRAGIDRGLSLRQIKAAEPTLAYDSRYGATRSDWTTERFIEAIYASLVDDAS